MASKLDTFWGILAVVGEEKTVSLSALGGCLGPGMCFRSRMRGGAPLLSAGSPLPGLPGEGPGLAAPLPGAPTFFLDFFFVFGMAAVRRGGGVQRLHTP